MGLLRIDPMEPSAPRPVRISDVRLAADDEPASNGIFMIRWSAANAVTDAAGDVASATVNLSWDLDQNPSNGRITIAQNLPAAAGQYPWQMGGLAPGGYWIYAEITDTAGNTQARYSTGPVGVTTTLPAFTDANADGIADWWEAKYGIGGASDRVRHPRPGGRSRWRRAHEPHRVSERDPPADPADVEPVGGRHRVLQRADRGRESRHGHGRGHGDVSARVRQSDRPRLPVAPQSRLTIPVNDVAGLSSTAVSAVVTATTGGVGVERTMIWDARTANNLYGAHTGKGIPAARTSWFLAEGEASFFETYILFANATAAPATVTATYLLETGAPVVRTYTVGASARVTIRTNDIPGVGGRAFSTAITSDVPITVERAMYFGSTPQRLWNGGHEAAAVAAPATSWFVAEGRTGPFFDMYLLLANPGAAATTATIRYLLPGGVVVQRTYPLGPQSRTTVHVDSQTAQLADTDVSAEITAPQPIVVERAMYWPDPFTNWYEAHNSAGVTTTGTLWMLADGEVGGPLGWSTYVLLANPTAATASATLTFLRAGLPPIVITRSVSANSRVTIDAASVGIGSGERFGVLVDTGAGGTPIVVEHAIYFNGPGGVFWGAGTNESGIRIR